mmetsp:Transcript_35250/g.58918  ORF Transcript_35250/g.58918 Transcript_35250/m.58918 type:complete len:956 (+) Transcript_35250:97-2964(+)|eukprot:CAMPEP_0184356914 /NCGR_PEP_ID=MMETSP1089-20130417/105861_1 /TAXON_ID=38269 ORGANISM="Gloeochaete wittrockiana, Strain SAG46.84" /NCGR_SAMPLE_ID=MMETSP1089 /ASSEMBLY_ACC=CAM_ASM_000445 /LENGTH=955 /DNA_ID=CAMNT_0026694393 /DNA_START=56 /DNA_END=2923 /DNA_ORIENTATION=+
MLRSFDINTSKERTSAPLNIEENLELMKKGALLLKYGRRGNPHFRHFKLSADLQRLEWWSGKKQENMSAVELSRVLRLQVGQQTKVFERHRRLDLVATSFSLLYDNRSLDLVCKDKKEFDIWCNGLKYMLDLRDGRTRMRSSFSSNSQSAVSSQLAALSLASATSSSTFRGTVPATIPEDDENDGLGRWRRPSSLTDYADVSPTASLAPYSSQNMPRRELGSVPEVPDPLPSGASFRSTKPLQNAVEKLRELFYTRGDVFTWGANERGQLGHGDRLIQRIPRLLEAMLDKDIKQIACGNQHAAALTEGGEVYTWGESSGGRLGHGIERDPYVPNPVSDLQGKAVRQVECGDYHTVCLLENGELYSFGSGDQGQLGHGSRTSQWFPHLVIAFFGKTVVHVSCGPWHTAAVLDNGELYTWGEGCWGQLGLGDKDSRDVPHRVDALLGKKIVRSICGCWHGAAIADDGAVYTWGDGESGQLGHGDRVTYLTPKLVDGLQGKAVKEMACGRKHSMALTDTGQVYTWGTGNIGHGKEGRHSTPLLVAALSAFKVQQIASGLDHMAALTDNGELYMWGEGGRFRLGTGDDREKPAPTLVQPFAGKKVRHIACGDMFSAAVSAHLWLPEELTGSCMSCKNDFSFVRRKHHCRNCGGIFCNSCSQKRFPLLKFGYEDPVRVCDNCFLALSGNPRERANSSLVFQEEVEKDRRSSSRRVSNPEPPLEDVARPNTREYGGRRLSNLLRASSSISSSNISDTIPRSKSTPAVHDQYLGISGPDSSNINDRSSSDSPDSMSCINTSVGVGDRTDRESRESSRSGRRSTLEDEVRTLREALKLERQASFGREAAMRKAEAELIELRKQIELQQTMAKKQIEDLQRQVEARKSSTSEAAANGHGRSGSWDAGPQQRLEEFTPGVYMSLTRRVEVASINFSKELFTREAADQWWELHQHEVFERYGPIGR